MIYEYALDPELVATWTQAIQCTHFKNCFSMGQGRIVSRYPKNWKRLVWNECQSGNDMARKRLEELLVFLSGRMVRRTNVHWGTDAHSWIENAVIEHKKRPFHAILARANPRSHAAVLTKTDLEEGNDPRWDVQSSLHVPRNSAQMAKVLAPILRCSTVAIFVDPYFDPEQERFFQPFEAFLHRMFRDRPCAAPSRIEVHTKAYDNQNRTRRRKDWQRLRQCVPTGARVKVRLLEDKQNGERLHNRYLLTDLGGVLFGTGLDERAGDSDDIALMKDRQYVIRWSQYGGTPPTGFKQEGMSVEIEGAGRGLLSA